MLKQDKNAVFTEIKNWFYPAGMRPQGNFRPNTYRFGSGKLVWKEISKEAYQSIMQTQKETPVAVAKDKSKVWWMFQNEFY